MTVRRLIPYVRILGYGDGAFSHAFVTDEPTTLPASGWSSATTHPVLVNPPSAFGNKLDPLQLIGGASDITFSLIMDGTRGASAVGGLLASNSLPLSDGAGGFVKTSGYINNLTTTIPVYDSGTIAPNDYVWIGGEVMQVSGTTATTLTVTRGTRDTWAKPIPYNPITSGTPVFGAAPSVYGLAVEAGTIDGTTSAEVVRWRGFVNSVTVVNGTQVRVKCRSLMGYLKSIEVQTPQARIMVKPDLSVIGSSRANAGQVVGTTGRFDVDANQYGDPLTYSNTEWDHIRIFSADDRWVVSKSAWVTTESDDFGRSFAQYNLQLTDVDADIVQVGTGDTVLYFDGDVLGDYYDFVESVLNNAVRAEYVQQVTSAGLGGVGQALVTVNPIAGVTAQLPGAWVDFSQASLSAASLSLANGLNDSNHYPPSYQGKFLELLSDLYLGPVFVALTESNGNLTLVDWVPDISAGSTVDIDADEYSRVDYTFQLKTSEARQIVGLRQSLVRRGTREYTTSIPNVATGGYLALTEDTETVNEVIIISELGVFANAWTGLEWIDVIGFSAASWSAIIARARTLVDIYDRSLPSVSIVCRPTADVGDATVGTIVRLLRPDLPTASGVRGSDNPRGVVTERSVNLLTGETRLRVLLIDWYASQLARGVWGPCAEVSSWVGGSSTATIKVNSYSSPDVTGALPTSDARAWQTTLTQSGQGSISVDLIDNEGAYRDTGKLTAVDVGLNTMTVTTLTATPVAGDRFILADAPTIDAEGWLTTTLTVGPAAWLADASGDVDGGTQPGRVYS